MSRYDYRDPGTDPDYCDNHSDPPDADSEQIDADLVCEHCYGTGEIRTDMDGPQDCPLCDGRGYVEEES